MASCPSCTKDLDATWMACPYCGERVMGNNSTRHEVRFTDSAMSGDIHHTVVNNDPAAVTTAVITALKELGMTQFLTSAPSLPAPSTAEEEDALPPSFSIGDHVEYHSPSNGRWLNRCTVADVNPDGTYRIEVPYDGAVQIKHAVVIGTSPGTIRPAAPPFEVGDRVMSDWRGLGHVFPGRIAKEHADHTFQIHYDDGDVEDHVEWSRLTAIAAGDDRTAQAAQQISEAEAELIQAFQAFDEGDTKTISADLLFEILTQMGEDSLTPTEAEDLFESMGLSGHDELDYRSLAKWMVGPDAAPFEQGKLEVLLKDAHIEDDVLHGYAYAHPKLGEGRVRTSKVLNITYDARATARVETMNTVYVVGPTGWSTQPEDHPFRAAHVVGEQLRVEWNGAWYDARIVDVDGDRYKITYDGYDSSWDEWVTTARMQAV